MIKCKELNKSFSSKDELFRALKENKDLIIAEKKASIIKSCEKGLGVSTKLINVSKALETVKSLEIDDDFYYIAVNTTKILDSHDDLHLNGIWNKTVKEQQGKVYLVLDHEMSVEKVVVKKQYIKMFVQEMPFKSLNMPYEGNTQALIYKVPKDKVINQTAKEWLESGDDIEASVRMQYVDIKLAMNSDNENDKSEKSNYDNYVNDIANKGDFDEINYFFTVSEAKNVRESSLVLFGSNHVTGQLNNKHEPSSNTHASKEAADNVTALSEFYKSIKF